MGFVASCVEDVAGRLGEEPGGMYRRLHDERTGLFLFSHLYLADEVALEKQSSKRNVCI